MVNAGSIHRTRYSFDLQFRAGYSYVSAPMASALSSQITANSNDTTFRQEMIETLLNYVINVHPRSIEARRLLNPLAKSVRGEPITGRFPALGTLILIDSYIRQEQGSMCAFGEDMWRRRSDRLR